MTSVDTETDADALPLNSVQNRAIPPARRTWPTDRIVPRSRRPLRDGFRGQRTERRRTRPPAAKNRATLPAATLAGRSQYVLRRPWHATPPGLRGPRAR